MSTLCELCLVTRNYAISELPVNSLVGIATPIRDVQHITPTSLSHGLAMLVISLARDRILYS